MPGTRKYGGAWLAYCLGIAPYCDPSGVVQLGDWSGGDAVGQPAPDGGIAGVADGVGEEVGEGRVVKQALGQQRGRL